MIHVSILALNRAVMASIADSRNVFSMVNQFLQEAGRPPAFEVHLVGLSPEITLNNGLFIIRPDLLADQVKQTDLIIIPSLSGDMMSAASLNNDFSYWIAEHYKNGAAVASLCVGAFLLAYSGLLTGKQCTTHWLYANEFRYLFPGINLVDEKMITDQNGLYSSGGNNAYWNLLLHLVEKYTDRRMAIHTAKYFVIDLDRTIQSPFVTFQGLRNHEDEMVKVAQDHIEHHYRDKLTVDQLAEKFNVTRRTFERRFKKATRYTVVEYIQRVKIEFTKKQLETGRKTVNEIIYSVGYTDIQTFRSVFKKITGMSPIEYRNKYNR